MVNLQESLIANLMLALTLLPLCSAALLLIAPALSIHLPRAIATLLGAGSVGAAALCAGIINYQLLGVDNFAITATYGNWLSVAGLYVPFGFYLDPLSLVMISIVTGVGFLIHLYSTGFMQEDRDYQRFFAYLNLFVAAMLVLVLADNMLLLFLGWEGVGLCSFLLIGFWHEENKNIVAANKAFIMTRVGDFGLALGLFLLFYQLGSLNIQAMQAQAAFQWEIGEPMVTLCCLLLLAGAVGKSGQLPLQSWLPDAMAGPTPVSALIHAATMVTAGVYLIARCHQLFELSPAAMHAVAMVGAITLFIAASAALVQDDVKRILAYSTVSQIGYMFLALGAGAYSAAIFHLMTHAFFKALLFLSAGALIFCMHHEHNIFRMGGLAKRLPVICFCFAIGCAALASLPLTSGFFSKELILDKLLEKEMTGLWLVAIAGAFLTAFYSFRLFFVVFFGEAKHQPDKQPLMVMTLPLLVLALLAAFGGLREPEGLLALFPEISEGGHATRNMGIFLFTIAVPLAGVAFSYLQFRRGVFHRPATLLPLHRFLYSGWAFDWLYANLLVKPYTFVAGLLRSDPVDLIPKLLAATSRLLGALFNQLQNGHLRWYNASIVLFSIAAITWMLMS